METSTILKAIDVEVAKLQRARAILNGGSGPGAGVRRKLGKPAKATGFSFAASAAPQKKRHMSAAARKKIAKAQRKRWAAYHASNAAKK